MFQTLRATLAPDDPSIIRLQGLMEEVKRLNSQVGIEDLTRDDDEDEESEGSEMSTDDEYQNDMQNEPSENMEEMVANEYDSVSGSHQYINTAVGGREYSAGVTIRPTVLELLRKWNESDIYSTAKYDYQFVQFLLIEAFGTVDLARRRLDTGKLDFVKGDINERFFVSFSSDKLFFYRFVSNPGQR